MKNKYKITVENINNSAETAAELLQFEVENHDDIFAIVKRLESRADFSSDDAKAFVVGLKLFSEVMLANKNLPLFSSFIPQFSEFMKELKKGCVS